MMPFYVVFAFILLLSSFAVVAFVVYLRYIRQKYAHLPSPPFDNWLLGHLPSIKRRREQGETYHHILHDFSLEYGNVFVLWFFYIPMVVAIGTEQVKKVLMTLNLPKSQKTYDVLRNVYNRRMIGDGILTECNTQVWLRKRMVLNPAFHRKYLMKFISDFNSICDKFIRKIGTFADQGIEVNFCDEFARVTMEIIAKVAFNMDINAVDDKNCPFLLDNYLVTKGAQECFKDFFWRFNIFSYPYQWKVIKAINVVRDYGRKVITDRIADMSKGKETPIDLLQHIIQLKTNDPSIDMEELIDNFLTFFLAGQETTSCHLAFSLYEIAKHPEIEQRVVEEVSSVLSGRHDVSYNDLSKLVYLGETLKESLRLHSPVGGITRFTFNEIELDGHKIPGGTPIEICFINVHLSENDWTNPKVFDPERFASTNSIPAETYLPFSVGPRSCIGKNLAQFESKVIIARLFQEFEFELVSPDRPLIYEEAITLRPRGGVWCKVKRR